MTSPATITGNSTLDAIVRASNAANTSRTTELFVLLGLGSIFTGLRTFGRIHVSGIKGLDWDDYLAWMAAVSNLEPLLWQSAWLTYLLTYLLMSTGLERGHDRDSVPNKRHLCRHRQ